VQDVDPPSRSREQTHEYGTEAFGVVSEKEAENSTTGRKDDVDTIWDAYGPVLENYQVRGTTVNIICYSEIL
jgi:hypothetical protein